MRWHSSFLNANCVQKYEWTGALAAQAGGPMASQYDPTQHFSHRLPRHAGPFREGLSLCKPFILFQTVCPQLFAIQFAQSRVPSWDHWRKVMCGIPTIQNQTGQHKCTRWYYSSHVLVLRAVVLCVCACMPTHYLLVELPCMWMMHLASMFISLELKGRTRTATFTEAPDMVAVLDSFPVITPGYSS